MWEHHGVPGCYGECLTSRHHWNTPCLPACVSGSLYQDRQLCLCHRAFHSKTKQQSHPAEEFSPHFHIWNEPWAKSAIRRSFSKNKPAKALQARQDGRRAHCNGFWSHPAEATQRSHSWAKRVRSDCLCCISPSSLWLPKVKSWTSRGHFVQEGDTMLTGSLSSTQLNMPGAPHLQLQGDDARCQV